MQAVLNIFVLLIQQKEKDEIIKEIRNYGETTHYWFYPCFKYNKFGNAKHFYKDN